MHPQQDDWIEDWSGTGHFFSAVMLKIEQNKLAIQKSHEQSRARQTLREIRGREYQNILLEMRTMTEPRSKVAATPRLIPTTETAPRQHQTDALDISLMPTMLVPVVRVPEKTATTDEIPLTPKRTSPLRDLVDFYQDANGTWCYVDKLASATDLVEKAIDAYVNYHQSVPAQGLHISSICMLLLTVAHKVTDGIYEDTRGSFILKSDACIDVDTVAFE